MRIAFLDLDHTLLVDDSNQLWMAFLLRQNAVSPAAMIQHEGFMEDYRRGTLDYPALRRFRVELDASLPADAEPGWRRAFEQDLLIPAIAPAAIPTITDLKKQGLMTVIVSATGSALVAPVAAHLGVDHAITDCFGQGKVRQVDAWLHTLGTSLARLDDSRFYSDSFNDLPLLQAVRRPIAVDPDARLMTWAIRHDWGVMSFRT
jgi:HAD superfamily phosphoserine phosphatase-like hydrolase